MAPDEHFANTALPRLEEPPTWQAVLWLAAAADCDVRTARKALTLGIDAIRPGRVRDRIEAAIRRARAE